MRRIDSSYAHLTEVPVESDKGAALSTIVAFCACAAIIPVHTRPLETPLAGLS